MFVGRFVFYFISIQIILLFADNGTFLMGLICFHYYFIFTQSGILPGLCLVT